MYNLETFLNFTLFLTFRLYVKKPINIYESGECRKNNWLDINVAFETQPLIHHEMDIKLDIESLAIHLKPNPSKEPFISFTHHTSLCAYDHG